MSPRHLSTHFVLAIQAPNMALLQSLPSVAQRHLIEQCFESRAKQNLSLSLSLSLSNPCQQCVLLHFFDSITYLFVAKRHMKRMVVVMTLLLQM
jgi:hypothetical protein